MNNKPSIESLKRMGACHDAIVFAREHKSLYAAWQACHRPDWMLWLLGRINYRDARAYRRFACWCARHTPLSDGRTTWDLLTDHRSRDAVDVAERYAWGKATAEELAAAGDAAWASARASAGDAARASAWASARAAACAAAEAAEAAAEAAAWAAAGDAAGDAQARQLRKFFPWTKVRAAITKWEKANG